MPGPAPGEVIDNIWIDAVSKTIDPWTSYAPVWSASGTAPVLGNGTLSGAYRQVGKTVTARGQLTMGSSTTFGSGGYRVSVPVAARSGSVSESAGVLWIFDSGVQTKVGACAFVDATRLWLVVPTGDITATNPHTWASGDIIRWTIEYEAA